VDTAALGRGDAVLWPRARRSHSLTSLGPGRDEIYLFGGLAGKEREPTGGELDDLWVFNASTRLWSAVFCTGDQPDNRHSHTMVCHEGKLFLFGGCGTHRHPDKHGRAAFNDVWEFDTQVTSDGEARWWRAVAGDVDDPSLYDQENPVRPCPRYLHIAAVLDRCMVIHGGRTVPRGGSNSYRTLSDTWSLDLRSYVWTRLRQDGPVPAPFLHSHVAIPHSGKGPNGSRGRQRGLRLVSGHEAGGGWRGVMTEVVIVSADVPPPRGNGEDADRTVVLPRPGLAYSW